MQRIEPHIKDLGGFLVRRSLPHALRRAVGPFVFVDAIGPAVIPPGEAGLNVRPHPHIGIATVTYLFEGTFVHRDSLGVEQGITPGAVNWMVAGRGIVHSERTPDDVRARGQRVHGLQTWYALPLHLEDCEPSFSHHPRETLPRFDINGVTIDVVLGAAFGRTSPVPVPVATLYAVAMMPAGFRLVVPADHEERAVCVVDGAVRVSEGGTAHELNLGVLGVIETDDVVTLEADAAARVVLIGGARLDAHRFMEWNFVSSRRDQLAAAVDLWRARGFPLVPGDDVEWISVLSVGRRRGPGRAIDGDGHRRVFDTPLGPPLPRCSQWWASWRDAKY